MVETYYFYSCSNGRTWVGYSIDHNKEQEKIVEKAIRDRIKNFKVKIIYKKEKNGKIEKRWNYG